MRITGDEHGASGDAPPLGLAPHDGSAYVSERTVELCRYLRGVADARLRQVTDTEEWEKVIWLNDLTDAGNGASRVDAPELEEWAHFLRPDPISPPPTPPTPIEALLVPQQLNDPSNPADGHRIGHS